MGLNKAPLATSPSLYDAALILLVLRASTSLIFQSLWTSNPSAWRTFLPSPYHPRFNPWASQRPFPEKSSHLLLCGLRHTSPVPSPAYLRPYVQELPDLFATYRLHAPGGRTLVDRHIGVIPRYVFSKQVYGCHLPLVI